MGGIEQLGDQGCVAIVRLDDRSAAIPVAEALVGVGGPRDLKDVLGPLPQIKLVPTGGVGFEKAGDFIRVGAAAVAMGSNLADAGTVAAREWATQTERARRLGGLVRDARSR